MIRELKILILILSFGIFYSCQDSDPIPLIPGFSVSDSVIVINHPITFTDLSEGMADSYLWTFEGGNPSTSMEATPAVVYSNPGTFDVELTISKGNRSETLIKPDFIQVYPVAKADFISSDTIINEGKQITFEDNSAGNIQSWAWTFEGGVPALSTNQNPIITYNISGIYPVELIVTDKDGVRDTLLSLEAVVVLPTDGLRGYYPMDGNLDDWSGNNFHGTFIFGDSSSGSPTYVKNRHGESDKALTLNGLDELVDLGSSVSDEIYNISFWFKSNRVFPTYANNTDGLNQDPAFTEERWAIISRGEALLSNQFMNSELFIGAHGWELIPFFEYVAHNFGAVYNWGISSDELLTSYINYSGTESILPSDEWIHVVMNKPFGWVNIEFVGSAKGNVGNNELEGPLSASDEPLILGSTFRITEGWNEEVIHYGFDGVIDNLRIYDRVLSEEEIALLNRE